LHIWQHNQNLLHYNLQRTHLAYGSFSNFSLG